VATEIYFHLAADFIERKGIDYVPDPNIMFQCSIVIYAYNLEIRLLKEKLEVLLVTFDGHRHVVIQGTSNDIGSRRTRSIQRRADIPSSRYQKGKTSANSANLTPCEGFKPLLTISAKRSTSIPELESEQVSVPSRLNIPRGLPV
jgi:hypothetical protein